MDALQRLAALCGELKQQIQDRTDAAVIVPLRRPFLVEVEELSRLCGFRRPPITVRQVGKSVPPVLWLTHYGFDPRATKPAQMVPCLIATHKVSALTSAGWKGIAATLAEWERGLSRMVSIPSNGTNKNARSKRTKEGTTQLVNAAIAFKMQNPDWTQKQCADKVGLSASTLNGRPDFREWWQKIEAANTGTRMAKVRREFDSRVGQSVVVDPDSD